MRSSTCEDRTTPKLPNENHLGFKVPIPLFYHSLKTICSGVTGCYLDGIVLDAYVGIKISHNKHAVTARGREQWGVQMALSRRVACPIVTRRQR